MHLVAETFHTLHLRKWEGARLCNEMDALLSAAQQDDLEAYPALQALFTALEASAGETDAAPLVDETEIEGDTDDADDD